MLLLLLGAAARRWLNRLTNVLGQLRRRPPKPPAEGARRATSLRTRTAAPLFIPLFLAAAGFGFFHFAVGLVDNVLDTVRVTALDHEPCEAVSEQTHARLERVESLRRRPGGELPEEARRQVREILEQERMLRYGTAPTIGWDRPRRWAERFRQEGAAAFCPRAVPMERIGLFPSLERWPAPAEEGRAAAALGLVLLCFFLAVVSNMLGSVGGRLGQVDWSLEWLFTFPVPARTLLVARVLEKGLSSFYGLLFFAPTLFCFYWAAGLSALSVPLALVSTVSLNLMASSVAELVETWLRLRLARDRLRNVQASLAFTFVLFMLAPFSLGFLPAGAELLVEVGGAMPTALAWLPPLAPAQMAGGGAATAMVVVLGGALVAVVLSTSAMAWLVRRGLSTSAGAFSGRRGVGARAESDRPRLLRGVLGKELTLILRDRSLLVRTMVVPILFVALQLLLNAGVTEVVSVSLERIAAAAFFVGAYAMMGGAFQILVNERQGLWLLLTTPVPLARVMLEKTLFWTVFGLIFPAAALVLGLIGTEESAPRIAWYALLVVAGTVICGFIAGGLGIVATDPRRGKEGAAARISVVYLYLILSSMYLYGLSSGSAWVQVGQLVIMSAAAVGIWQRVRDLLPLLLDPTAEEPARLRLADGLLAALFFLTLQGVIQFTLATFWEVSSSAASVLAYATAGLMVVAAVLLVLRRRGVPRLSWELGLRRSGESSSMALSLSLGLLGGSVAAMVSALYLEVVDRLEPLRTMRDEVAGSELALTGPWLVLLVVICAPVFEELLFRGLIFRSLERSLPRWAAVAGSAALFALVHPPLAAPPVFVVGCLAALVYACTRWLAAPILVHALYNLALLWQQQWS